MIDLLLLAVVALVAWCVASDGAFSAGITFLCVLLAGIVAMNFFEPVAIFIERNIPSIARVADVAALVGIFIAATFALRLGTEQIVKLYVELIPLAHDILRWVFGVATGYVTMAFLLTALHTAPFEREFLGFRAERANLFNIAAPDRQWLGFTQYLTEHSFARRDGHAFDTLMQATADPTRPDLLSTFTIRYATRRANNGGGGAGGGTATAPAPIQTAPGAPVNPGF